MSCLLRHHALLSPSLRAVCCLLRAACCVLRTLHQAARLRDGRAIDQSCCVVGTCSSFMLYAALRAACIASLTPAHFSRQEFKHVQMPLCRSWRRSTQLSQGRLSAAAHESLCCKLIRALPAPLWAAGHADRSTTPTLGSASGGSRQWRTEQAPGLGTVAKPAIA